MSEVGSHNTATSCWVIIKPPKADTPNVYDVTDYLDEHPGGSEVILENAGTECTDAFEDIGHSKDARLKLESFLIGQLHLSEEELAAGAAKKAKGGAKGGATAGGGNMAVIAIVIVLLAIAAAVFLQQQQN